MATVADLKSALRDTLEDRGVLAELKARVRAELFYALEEEERKEERKHTRPQLTHQNLLINELIRQYLRFNHYQHTLSVLTAESGQPEVPLERHFLTNELNVVEDQSAKSVPLLYSILAYFQRSAGEKGNKVFLHNTAQAANPEQS